MNVSRPGLLWCAVFLPWLLVGCSDAKQKLYPVRGRVLDRDGKGAVGALVVLHPTAGDGANVAKPVGRADAAGDFRLTTHVEGDGASPGEFAVTVVWQAPRKTPFDPEGPDQLRGSYADPKNPKVRFTVEPREDNEIPTIRLP
jgi:hypothetical protein